MPNPFYLSRREVAANEWTITVKDNGGGGATETLTIAAGFYYPDADVASASLRAALKTAFDSHSTLGASTVSYSTTTGKYTISFGGSNFDLTFPNTVLRDWMGFAVNKTGVTTTTSDNVSQGVIFAGSGRSRYTGVMRETTSGQRTAESGVVATIGSGTTRRMASWRHQFERISAQASPLESGTFDNAGTTVVPWTWMDFFEHHWAGQPFRYHAAAGDAVGSHEDTYVLTEQAASEFKPSRTVEESDTYWTIDISARRFVST